MKKRCFRCTGYIDDDSNYYAFHEMNNNKLINIDYCHKECWDKFLKNIGNTTEAMGMLRGLKQYAQKMGILPPTEEVVEIK